MRDSRPDELWMARLKGMEAEVATLRTDLATAGKRICELTGRVTEVERQRDLALAGEQEKACRIAEVATILDEHEGNPALAVMLARAALAPRSERREGEPCPDCGHPADSQVHGPKRCGGSYRAPAAPRSERREGEPGVCECGHIRSAHAWQRGGAVRGACCSHDCACAKFSAPPAAPKEEA